MNWYPARILLLLCLKRRFLLFQVLRLLLELYSLIARPRDPHDVGDFWKPTFLYWNRFVLQQICFFFFIGFAVFLSILPFDIVLSVTVSKNICVWIALGKTSSCHVLAWTSLAKPCIASVVAQFFFYDLWWFKLSWRTTATPDAFIKVTRSSILPAKTCKDFLL